MKMHPQTHTISKSTITIKLNTGHYYHYYCQVKYSAWQRTIQPWYITQNINSAKNVHFKLLLHWFKPFVYVCLSYELSMLRIVMLNYLTVIKIDNDSDSLLLLHIIDNRYKKMLFNTRQYIQFWLPGTFH